MGKEILIENWRDPPKLNVWCGIMIIEIVDPSFFTEKSITRSIYIVYHYMLERVWNISQLQDIPKIIFAHLLMVFRCTELFG